MFRLLVTLLCAAMFFQNPAAASGSEDKFGNAPIFQLRDVSGKLVSLQDYSDHVILINFWASWCGPCLIEMPHLQKIYNDLKSEKFIVLGINIDEPRDVSKVKPLARKTGVSYPILLDKNKQITSIYNPSMILPYSVIINKKGEIYGYFEGYTIGMEGEIRKVVEEALDAH